MDIASHLPPSLSNFLFFFFFKRLSSHDSYFELVLERVLNDLGIECGVER